MNTQPEALRLADLVEQYNDGVHSQSILEDYSKAAAELRRLHEVNQMLVETLDWLDTWLGDKPMVECSHRITKALAKLKEKNA
jgi:hypothetical protein